MITEGNVVYRYLLAPVFGFRQMNSGPLNAAITSSALQGDLTFKVA